MEVDIPHLSQEDPIHRLDIRSRPPQCHTTHPSRHKGRTESAQRHDRQVPSETHLQQETSQVQKKPHAANWKRVQRVGRPTMAAKHPRRSTPSVTSWQNNTATRVQQAMHRGLVWPYSVLHNYWHPCLRCGRGFKKILLKIKKTEPKCKKRKKSNLSSKYITLVVKKIITH